MKKRILSTLLAASMMLGLAACGGGTATTPTPSAAPTPDATVSDQPTPEVQKEVPEVSTIRWNCGTSGDVLLNIALEKGYLDEVGLKIEFVNATANADAMALLATGQADIASNSGTSNPLQQIAAGVDLTIFGGHMVNGCMPVIAKAGTQWNGIQDVVGKRFACNPSYFAFTGAVMDLGYDNPLEVVDWVVYTNYSDALAAVVRGEVDYALQGTGQNFPIQSMSDVEIMCYQSDVMPNYSCCRMECPTEFIEKNPTTIKLLLKALIRAQCFYENNKDEALKIHAKATGTEEDYVAAFMLNDHYLVHTDPLKNSVVRAWGILDKTGFLSENAKNIDINDHINTELYVEALKDATAEYGHEDPDFYASLQTFYEENNT